MPDPEEEGLRLLSFDGGDIRCLSQLDILDEFLYQVQWKKKSREPLLASTYFHMIVGVGPAGFIVILLVIFRMSVQDAKEEFVKMWESVFADESYTPTQRSAKLEEVLRDLFERRSMDWNQRLLQDDDTLPCKGFVCAASSVTPNTCLKLRTYNGPERVVNVSLQEAIRSTCAIPGRFDDVRVGLTTQQQQRFISGVISFNNPTQEAIQELHDIYGSNRRVSCILSLGSGKTNLIDTSNLQALDKNGISLNARLTSERTADELFARLGSSGVYHRFSVERGLESSDSISMDNIGVIESLSKAYLMQATTRLAMEVLILAAEQGGRLTTSDICRTQATQFVATHGLPQLCVSFVAREALLSSMQHALFHSDQGYPRVMVLSGLGGSGKTQMASHFARIFSSSFHYVLFVNGRTLENIESGIIAAAGAIGSTCRSLEAALEFLAHPDHTLRPWLLIIDNVDDPTIELAPFIPSCDHGFIIVTTRNRTQGNLSPNAHVEFEVMTETEAIEAFLRAALPPRTTASSEDRKYGLAIVKQLGYLPVAIIQAGSYVKQRHCMKDYLGYLKSDRARILSAPAKNQRDKHYHAVYATLDVTLQVLSPNSKRLLGLLACFEYTGFPIPLIERAASRQFLFEPYDLLERTVELQEVCNVLTTIFCPDGTWSKLAFEEVLVELEEFSLITQMENYSMMVLRFHPLVHAWMWDRITAPKADEYRKAAIRLIVCLTGEEDEDIYEQILPHLAPLSSALESAHVNDLAGIARIRLWEGKREITLQMWDQIRQKVAEVHGIRHLRTSRAELQWGLILSNFDLAQAYRSIKAVARIREVTLPEDHIERLQAATYLRELNLRVLGSGEHNIEPQTRVVKVLQTLDSGTPTLLTIKAMEVLARMYDANNQTKDAKALMQEVVRLRVGLQGENHTMSLKTKELLAMIGLNRLKFSHWSEVHNGERPEPVYVPFQDREVMVWVLEDLLKQRKTLHGPYHPDTLKAQTTLVLVYQQNCSLQLAIGALEEIVEGWSHRNGPDDLTTLASVESLANLLVQAGRHEEAVVQWRDVVAGYRKIRGPQHHRTLHAIESLATLLTRLANYAEAAALWHELIKGYKATIGVADLPTLEAMEKLARLYEEWERNEEAVAQWQQVVASYKSTKGSRSFLAIDCLVPLAYLLDRMERYDESMSVCEEFLKECQDRNTPIYCGVTRLFATSLEKAGRFNEAIVQWNEAINFWQFQGEAFFYDIISAQYSLARLLQKTGRINEETSVRVDYWNRCRRWIGSTSAETREAAEEVINVFERAGQNPEASLQKKTLVDTGVWASIEKDSRSEDNGGQNMTYSGMLISPASQRRDVLRDALRAAKTNSSPISEPGMLGEEHFPDHSRRSSLP